MHPSGMNITPAIAKSVSIVTGDMKSLAGAVLQGGHRVVPTFDQKFYGLGAELCAVEAIEQDRPSSPLSVTDLSGEDRFARVPTPRPLPGNSRNRPRDKIGESHLDRS